MFNPVPFILTAIFVSLIAFFLGRDYEAGQYTTGVSDTPRAWLAYHGAELRYHYANLGVSGALPAPIGIDGIAKPAAFASCLSNKILATYLVGFSRPPAPTAIVAAARTLYAGDPNIGLAAGGDLQTPFGPVALPCAIPDGTPVVIDQVAP